MHPAIELDLETDTPQRRIFLTDLVARVSTRDPSGIHDLYHLFSPGIRFFLRRQPGLQNLDDHVATILATLTESIQHGDLTEPVQLVAFVRNILRREMTNHPAQPAARRPAPQHNLQNVAVAKEILTASGTRERDALVRFHVCKHPPARICADLNLTEQQFHLLLARARTAFAERMRGRAQKRDPGRATQALSARQSILAS